MGAPARAARGREPGGRRRCSRLTALTAACGATVPGTPGAAGPTGPGDQAKLAAARPTIPRPAAGCSPADPLVASATAARPRHCVHMSQSARIGGLAGTTDIGARRVPVAVTWSRTPAAQLPLVVSAQRSSTPARVSRPPTCGSTELLGASTTHHHPVGRLRIAHQPQVNCPTWRSSGATARTAPVTRSCPPLL